MNTTRLEEPFGDILIPRDRAVSQVTEHLKTQNTLPLISVHGPSGVGKTHLAGPVLQQELKKFSGKSNPKLLRIQITGNDSSVDIALAITDMIIENHSEFRSRKAAKVFRDKMQRSVRRSPSEAAERLRSMMRTSEKGKFDFKKLQLLICLDGVDRLFENRARCGADLSKAAICGDVNDPVGFLNKLVGMNTILFTMVFRSWVARDVKIILDRGGLDKSRRYDLLLSYPNPEEVEDIVAKVLTPVKEYAKNPSEVDEYGDLLTDTLRKNPALTGAVPATVEKMFRDNEGDLKRTADCVDRYLENNGLAGELAKKADEIYLAQNSNNKLALEEVFANLIKNDGRLLIKDAVMSEELWAIALTFVDNRILAIDGRSYRDARFIVTHKALLSTWTRAIGWTETKKRSVGITQLRSFDDKALSWQLAEKNKALLIESDEILENARLVLNDSELASQLSSLTKEYLTRSLKPKRDMKKILLSKKLWIPVGSVFTAFFAFVVFIIVVPDPAAQAEVADSNQDAAVEPVQPAGDAEEITEDTPVPQSVLEEIEAIPLVPDLLASAELISVSATIAEEEVPLLPEMALLPQEEEGIRVEEVAEPVMQIEPLPSEREVISHIVQLQKETESKIPLTLPSAQAHLKKKLEEITEQTVQTEVPIPVEEKSVGKQVPAEALEAASGHIEKRKLVDVRENDSARLYNGLSNHRLEIGGAESKIENITSKSSWRKILNAMGEGIAHEDMDEVLDALIRFHEKTVVFPDEIKNIQVAELRDLTSHLGKVALIQKDRVAMQGAWKLELVSQNMAELNTGLRMLMARVAINAGREKEAVAILAQTGIQDEINQASIDFMKAAVGWHFNEGGKAAENFRKLLPPQANVH
ncbi:MAG: hypothetical protein P1V20_23325 [Verrucomicrobiales bacterium]|nr:hypothetical protein [Verrucomicrobiales bacterium]